MMAETEHPRENLLCCVPFGAQDNWCLCSFLHSLPSEEPNNKTETKFAIFACSYCGLASRILIAYGGWFTFFVQHTVSQYPKIINCRAEQRRIINMCATRIKRHIYSDIVGLLMRNNCDVVGLYKIKYTTSRTKHAERDNCESRRQLLVA